MIIALDFDGTVIEDIRAYDDLTTPMRLQPNAKMALLSLKAAGHKLILWSSRASRGLLEGPDHDPLVFAGIKKANEKTWEKNRELHRARYLQMLRFVETELPDIFDMVDDGTAGKLAGVDLFIDDRALRFGRGPLAVNWTQIAEMYGDVDYSEVRE